jgi:hypothetical protein
VFRFKSPTVSDQRAKPILPGQSSSNKSDQVLPVKNFVSIVIVKLVRVLEAFGELECFLGTSELWSPAPGC